MRLSEVKYGFSIFYLFFLCDILSICFSISVEKSELSGVWGKELSESDEKKKEDERSERVFLTPIVLVLFLQKVRKK
jgi:hypothetical protein